MQRFRKYLLSLLVVAAGVAISSSPCCGEELAQGMVFHDLNRNGQREQGEPGIAGVRVSNGLDVVATDAAGKYAIAVDDDTIVFVIKPRDWQTGVDHLNMPRFYYIHKPNGSPDKDFQFAGVEPTGPLPEAINFALTPHKESEEFSIVVMGDPQPINRQQVRYYANDVIAELVDAKVAFGISMGDIVGDKLSLFNQVNAVQSKVGVPWYNVHGNHDMNFHSPNDEYADETFERIYGPTNFAFQWASVHFIVLDNVLWKGFDAEMNGGKIDQNNYTGAISEQQLQFIANYLQGVPTDERVVICTHIPLIGPDETRHGTPEMPQLLKILANHPHQISFSAHTHYNQHAFAKSPPEHLHTDHNHSAEGSPSHHHFQLHHHHNTATGSGSWFRGPKDEQGFPMTPMRDGVPNGYIIATFSGNDYKLRYKAARMPTDYQMSIHAPEVTQASKVSETEVLVNVFNGTEKSTVRMRVRGSGDWLSMSMTTREDPTYRAFFERDKADKDRKHVALPGPVKTPHLWVANLPAEISPGVHVLEVEATDMFGQVDRGKRLIEVDADVAANDMK